VVGVAGAAAFDLEYARWVEEHHRLMCDLRAALQSRLADTELRVLVSTPHTHLMPAIGSCPLGRSLPSTLPSKHSLPVLLSPPEAVAFPVVPQVASVSPVLLSAASASVWWWFVGPGAGGQRDGSLRRAVPHQGHCGRGGRLPPHLGDVAHHGRALLPVDGRIPPSELLRGKAP